MMTFSSRLPRQCGGRFGWPAAGAGIFGTRARLLSWALSWQGTKVLPPCFASRPELSAGLALRVLVVHVGGTWSCLGNWGASPIARQFSLGASGSRICGQGIKCASSCGQSQIMSLAQHLVYVVVEGAKTSILSELRFVGAKLPLSLFDVCVVIAIILVI